MEFNRNQPAWYWVALFLIYIGGVVALLFSFGNPYLYSTRILKSELSGAKNEIPQPFPSPEKQSQLGTELDAELDVWRMNLARTAADGSGQTRDRKWVENWTKPVWPEEIQDKNLVYHLDTDGIFVGDSKGQIWKTDLEGQPVWKLRLNFNENESFQRPIADKGLVYFASSHGRLIAINKQTGSIHWDTRVAREILSEPFLRGDDLLIVIEPEANLRQQLSPSLVTPQKGKGQDLKRHNVIRMHRKDGTVVSLSAPFEVKGSTTFSYLPESDQIILSSHDRLVCLDGINLQVQWSQLLPEEIHTPAVLTGSMILTTAKSGKLSAFSLAKKGALIWEVDLETPALAAPTHVPVYEFAAVPAQDGTIHMINLKKGEREWRLGSSLENPLKESWSTRLNGRMIELTKMKWNFKGWTLWSPCSWGKICLINPDQGQVLERISLSGQVLSAPSFAGKGFYILLRDKLGLKVSHAMEEDDWEKMKKEEKAAREQAEAGKAPAG